MPKIHYRQNGKSKYLTERYIINLHVMRILNVGRIAYLALIVLEKIANSGLFDFDWLLFSIFDG